MCSRAGLRDSAVWWDFPAASSLPWVSFLTATCPFCRLPGVYRTPHSTPHLPQLQCFQLSSPLSLVYWSSTSLQYRLVFPKMCFWPSIHQLLRNLLGRKEMVHGQVTLGKSGWTESNGLLLVRTFWESVPSQPGSLAVLCVLWHLRLACQPPELIPDIESYGTYLYSLDS